jgi:hypothetical protein
MTPVRRPPAEDGVRPVAVPDTGRGSYDPRMTVNAVIAAAGDPLLALVGLL